MTSIKSSGPIQSSVLTSMNSQAEMSAELGGDINAQLAAMVLKHSQSRQDDLESVRDLEEANILKAEKAQIGAMMDQADATRSAGRADALGQLTGAVLAGVSAGGDKAAAGKAAGELANAVGGLVAAGSKHEAAVAQVNATEHGNAVEAAKRRLEEVSSGLSEAKVLAREGVDFLKEIRRQEAQTNNAALFLKV